GDGLLPRLRVLRGLLRSGRRRDHHEDAHAPSGDFRRGETDGPGHAGARGRPLTTTRRLLVLPTVDTEVWPFRPGWPNVRLAPGERDLACQYERCILGATDRGEFGLRYQLDLLNRHGLRATFFVEPLHAAAVGDRWLKEMVGTIVEAGQDVQLHAHTE